MKVGYARTVKGYIDILEQGFILEDYGVDLKVPESDERDRLSVILPELQKKKDAELVITSICVLEDQDAFKLMDIVKDLEDRKIKLTILN